MYDLSYNILNKMERSDRERQAIKENAFWRGFAWGVLNTTVIFIIILAIWGF